MLLSAKFFSERLNNCLDDMGVPSPTRERAQVLSKMLNIPRQQAFGLLEGHHTPDVSLLENIAHEFEVDLSWLVGERS